MISMGKEEKDERLREKYRQDGWGRLAEEAGFDPIHTETSARRAFEYCAKVIKMKDETIAAARKALMELAG